MSNHSQCLKNIWPDVIHNVGVGTPEQLVITFQNGYFFLLTLFSLAIWEIMQGYIEKE